MSRRARSARRRRGHPPRMAGGRHPPRDPGRLALGPPAAPARPQGRHHIQELDPARSRGGPDRAAAARGAGHRQPDPPAVLGKIATTVDVVSGGRLVLGIGVGGTHQPSGAGGVAGENPAVAEYEAYGLTLVPPAEGIARLAESADILRRMWTEHVFDHEGRHYRLRGTRNEPKPVQRPAPPPAADRRLGNPAAEAGRRAGRHLEHPRAAAQPRRVHRRSGAGAGGALRRHRPPSAGDHPLRTDRGLLRRSRRHPRDGRRTRGHRCEPCRPRRAGALSAGRRAMGRGRDHRAGRRAAPRHGRRPPSPQGL
jgi:hypothetical protein